jgi:hypothetical protein
MKDEQPGATLRRFARRRPASEPCELCNAALAPQHQHLLQLAARQLLCCCEACAILFSGPGETKYRRVPRRIELLTDVRMTDAQWDDLGIPISIAFFVQDSAEVRLVARYPSPAGATESLPRLDAWEALVEENPVLSVIEPDVEALLVNRLGSAREYYRAPIDECFKLVGLIRANWRGLSGGTEVWSEVTRFFGDLRGRSIQRPEAASA